MRFTDFSIEEDVYMTEGPDIAWENLNKKVTRFEDLQVAVIRMESLTYKCKKFPAGIYGGTIRIWYMAYNDWNDALKNHRHVDTWYKTEELHELCGKRSNI